MQLASCEEDYKLYDTNQVDAVSFNYYNSRNVADSVITYNFGYDIAEQHEIDIPVTLMGLPKSEARSIDLKVVADSTDMVEGVNYTVARAEIGANAVRDTVKITLSRLERMRQSLNLMHREKSLLLRQLTQRKNI